MKYRKLRKNGMTVMMFVIGYENHVLQRLQLDLITLPDVFFYFDIDLH